MSATFRILVLEDSPLDMELMRERVGAIDPEAEIVWAKSRLEFEQAIDREAAYDVVLADYVVPGLDGFDALDLAQERLPDVPFVYVSGTLGEELAIESLKRGATDYVLKQRLQRLPDVVRRAIQEAGERRRRRRAEAELQALNATLEQRVQERTAELRAEAEERRRAEQSLRVSEARYRAIVDHAPEAIFVLKLTESGALTYESGNPAARALFGRNEADMAGQTIGEVLPELTEVARNCADGAEPCHLEHELQRGEATEHRETILVPIVDGEGAIRVMGSSRDVTARREREAGQRQAQRMEVIGRMTGGVAHDFNNILTVIVGNLDMIGRRPEDAERVQRLAHNAVTAARRGEQLTQQLLAFSRRQSLKREVLDLNRAVEELLPLLQRAVGEAVEVAVETDGEPAAAELDAMQFEAALLNLAVNARDAMPDGGQFVVRLGGTAEEGTPCADGTRLPPGRYVVLEVADTGEGIPAEALPRIFEPFFTTKDVGRGSGLGLSQVYGFLRQINGNIAVESNGTGTLFRIFLPRSERQPAPPPGLVDGADEPLHPAGMDGERTVLVVDDDAQVLQMAVAALGELGFRVISAGDGREALGMLGDHPEVTLLFTDVVMPHGYSGIDLAREATARRPDLKVLLSSGYVGPDGGEAAPPDHPLLKKPYRPAELAAAIGKVMGAAVSHPS